MEVPIECPSCKKSFKRKAKDLKDGTKLNCPHCKAEIAVSGSGFTDAAEGLESLERATKNLFKK